MGIRLQFNIIFVLLSGFLKAFTLIRTFKMLKVLVIFGSIFSVCLTVTLGSRENGIFLTNNTSCWTYVSFWSLRRLGFPCLSWPIFLPHHDARRRFSASFPVVLGSFRAVNTGSFLGVTLPKSCLITSWYSSAVWFCSGAIFISCFVYQVSAGIELGTLFFHMIFSRSQQISISKFDCSRAISERTYKHIISTLCVRLVRRALKC